MEAQFIAQENTRLHQETHPLAAETVLKSTYMDDSIDSAETDEIGVKLHRQLSSFWNHVGMQARKWVSNSEAVMEAIPEEDQAVQLNITDDKYPVVKTLGVAWDSKEDILTLPELITICAGVKGFLNSRPIAYQSMNRSDDVPLTPNHFFHGQARQRIRTRGDRHGR
jgi:hypothetical protein